MSLQYTTFDHNSALDGGALYILGSASITQSTFEKNSAYAMVRSPALVICYRNPSRNFLIEFQTFSLQGGAIAVGADANLQLATSSFKNNGGVSGGAIYTCRNSHLDIQETDFNNNKGLDGGAIYSQGFSNILGSKFTNNFSGRNVRTRQSKEYCFEQLSDLLYFSISQGGVLYVGPTASTKLLQNQLYNNGCGSNGPVVYDRFHTAITTVNNTACGNRVNPTNLPCDGILVQITTRRQSCLAFANACIPATEAPSVNPSQEPTNLLISPITETPSVAASSPPSPLPYVPLSIAPTYFASYEPTYSSYPSEAPSTISSSVPSSSSVSFKPSLIPSNRTSGYPTEVTDSTPSSLPRGISSGISTLQPTFEIRSQPTGPTLTSSNPTLERANPGVTPALSSKPSLVHSDYPSLIPSSNPSSTPTFVYSRLQTSTQSESPIIAATIQPTHPSEFVSASPSLLAQPIYKSSLVPTSGSRTSAKPTRENFPSDKPSFTPTEDRGYAPSNSPSQFPSVTLNTSDRSLIPSDVPSNVPSNKPSLLPPMLRNASKPLHRLRRHRA